MNQLPKIILFYSRFHIFPNLACFSLIFLPMPKESEFWLLTFNAGTEDVPELKKVYQKEEEWSIQQKRTKVTCMLCIHINATK